MVNVPDISPELRVRLDAVTPATEEEVGRLKILHLVPMSALSDTTLRGMKLVLNNMDVYRAMRNTKVKAAAKKDHLDFVALVGTLLDADFYHYQQRSNLEDSATMVVSGLVAAAYSGVRPG